MYNINAGEHSLIVYPDLADLREIYTSFCKHALVDNNNLVIILYHYDNPNNIRYYLQNIGIDASKYEKEHSLLILDSYESSYFQRDNSVNYDSNDGNGKVSNINNKYSNVDGDGNANGSNIGSSSSVSSKSGKIVRSNGVDFESLLKRAQRKGKRGISIIADMGSFFYKGDSKENLDLLLYFENAIPKKFRDKNIVRLCLYHRNDINKIVDKEKRKLCNTHLQCFQLKEHV